MGNKQNSYDAMRGMTNRHDIAALNHHLAANPMQGAATAIAGPGELGPLPCLPGCIADHDRDVSTKCCEVTSVIGSVTPSYGEPQIDVTAHSYTEGSVRSAEVQLGGAPRARFLDPDQALALAQLLIEAVAKATAVARG